VRHPVVQALGEPRSDHEPRLDPGHVQLGCQ
jgi:hypothetical protein